MVQFSRIFRVNEALNLPVETKFVIFRQYCWSLLKSEFEVQIWSIFTDWKLQIVFPIKPLKLFWLNVRPSNYIYKCLKKNNLYVINILLSGQNDSSFFNQCNDSTICSCIFCSTITSYYFQMIEIIWGKRFEYSTFYWLNYLLEQHDPKILNLAPELIQYVFLSL